MASVSIIIPVYNAQEFLRFTLESLQRQSYSDFEVLIVDDCSIDNSVVIAQEFSVSDSRFSLVQNSANLGAAMSRTKGIQMSNGRYIAFLDADDTWHPEKLKRQVAVMQSTHAAMSCTAVDVISFDGQVLGSRTVPEKITYGTLAKKTPIVNSTVMLDASIVGKISVPDIRRRQDFALWLKIVREHGPAVGIATKLAQYRVHQKSLSRNKVISAMYTWKVLRNVEGLGFIQASYYFLFYSLKGLVERFRGLN